MARVFLCRHWRTAVAAFCFSIALVGTLLHPHSALQAFLSTATAPAAVHNHQTESTAAAATDSTAYTSSEQPQRSFTIENDQFMRDGQPFQILSGSTHYHCIPPDLWLDRLQRIKALGLNAIQLYVPWNFHQPSAPGPEGVLPFSGWRDLPGFIRLAADQGLLVLLRPGPYICAEWEFGGFPAWLLAQNTSIHLRSSDPAYLDHVDVWWGKLLQELAGLTYDKGGPIIMVQIENEYGYYGGDKMYLRHLADLVRQYMGDKVLLYTVDGAALLPLLMGSLPGGDVLTTVDFGPTTNVKEAFALQKRFNPPGKSPPFCVEYYTGWLTHWGEPMAKTSAEAVAKTLTEIVTYHNNTGSVNLYMAHGGTNFGPWAGTNVFSSLIMPQQQRQRRRRQQQALLEAFAADIGFNSRDGFTKTPGPALWRLHSLAAVQQQQQQQHRKGSRQQGSGSSSSSSNGREIFSPHITSYDYNCPIGESGSVGNAAGAAAAGTSGSSKDKFAAVRAVLAAAQNIDISQLPAVPPPVPSKRYDNVVFSDGLYVMEALDELSSSCRVWGSSSGYCSSTLLQQQQQQKAVVAMHSSLRAQQESLGDDPHRLRNPDFVISSRTAVQSESAYPLPTEQYGQYYGLVVYETVLPAAAAAAGEGGALLDFVAHDTVWAFLDGALIGRSYRGAPSPIRISDTSGGSSSSSSSSSSGDTDSSSHKQQQQQHRTAAHADQDLQETSQAVAASRRMLSTAADAKADGSSRGSSSNITTGALLQLLIWPFGRSNFATFGGTLDDHKGLVSNVTLTAGDSNTLLTNWKVHHLCLSGGGGLGFNSSSEQNAGFADLHLPWRPIVTSEGASAGGGGAGEHWLKAGSSSSSTQAKPLLLRPTQQQQQHMPAAAVGVEHRKSSSNSNGSNNGVPADQGIVGTVAEAQAQAIIAAAAEAATGSGPATAAARGVASIRAGWAAAAAADASMDVQGNNKGPLLLRGSLHVPQTPALNAAGTSSSSSSSDQPWTVSPDRPADTFLVLGEGWGRGEVWVNGHHLGRYWPDQGPQMTLFCPGSFLQAGAANEVVILELDGKVPVLAGQGIVMMTSTEPDFSGPKGGPGPLNQLNHINHQLMSCTS